MAERKRAIQLKFYVTEQERTLIEEKMKLLVVRQIKRGCFRHIKTVRKKASSKYPVTLLSVHSAH